VPARIRQYAPKQVRDHCPVSRLIDLVNAIDEVRRAAAASKTIMAPVTVPAEYAASSTARLDIWIKTSVGWYQIFFYDPEGNVIGVHQATE
jgi:hypothetical protein